MSRSISHGQVMSVGAAKAADQIAKSTEQPLPFVQLFGPIVGDKPDAAQLVTLQDRMRDDNSADNGSNVTPAGFTFFGQFIDHDLTLTAVAQDGDAADFNEFRKELPLSALRNVRTAELELDSVFGRGPEGKDDAGKDIAHLLYRNPPHDLRLRTGSDTHAASWDLPRQEDGQAIIGDGRNDENKLIAQVHGVFLRAYNRFYEQATGTPTERYVAARGKLTQSYHAIVVHDYVARFCAKPVLQNVMESRAPRYRAVHAAADAARKASMGASYVFRADMPAEFAFAMFRFGHSQVRNGYAINATTALPTFLDGAADLGGKQPIPAEAAWDHRLFFDDRIGTLGYTPPQRLNFSRRIDTVLAEALFRLKQPAVDPATQERSLARRNVQRARLIALASGEQIAQAMGLVPLTPQQLGTADLPGVAGRTPLWFYILKEAELAGGERLGTMGSMILAETILGILSVAESSFYRNRDWSAKPDSGIATMRQLADFAAGA
jgi:hypothetical protein